jgi:hypothetical protein
MKTQTNVKTDNNATYKLSNLMFSFDSQIRYFSNEIRLRNKNYHKFIEIWINDYLNSKNFSKSFEFEIIWSHWANLHFSITDFIDRYNGKLSFYHNNSLNDFILNYQKFVKRWIKLRRNKSGEWIDGSSKLSMLVRKVMKEQNFESRMSYLYNGY